VARRGRRRAAVAGAQPRPGGRARPTRARARRDGHMGARDRAAAGPMRVAYYSPMPPTRSGVADYSALLVPALGRRADLDIMRPGRHRRRSPDVRLFPRGNARERAGCTLAALRPPRGLAAPPGLATPLRVGGVPPARGDGPGSLAAMQREAGVVGRLPAHGVIAGLLPPLWERRST